MELTFLDRNLTPIGLLDTYKSVLWTEKYRGEGELKLENAASPEFIKMVRASRWVSQPASDNLMELDQLSVKAHVDQGDLVTIHGRSLEWLTKTRVVYDPVSFNTSLETVVRGLLNNHFITPSDTNRKYPYLSMPSSFTSAKAKTFNVRTSRKKLPVQTILEDFLSAAKVGYRIHWVPGTQQFIFDLYDGRDYSNADSVAYVEFSRDFDNLSNSEYNESDSSRFTRGYIDGKLGNTDVSTRVDKGAVGIDLREAYIAGSQVESKTAAGADMTAAQYRVSLAAYAQKEYARLYTQREYSCEVDPYRGFIYGQDFTLGDTVMIRDQYGYSERSRVTEVAFSASTSTVSIVPSFSPDADTEITEQQ